MTSTITVLGDPGFGALPRAERRKKLNQMIEAKYRRNGLMKTSNLDVEEALAVLNTGLPPRDLQAPIDRTIINRATWNLACMLDSYLNAKTWPYQRDFNQYGVYVLFEMKKNKRVPLFVEALPQYVGMSTVLSSRLRFHAQGNFMSTPAEHVTQEYLATCTEGERAVYAMANRDDQLLIRRACMDNRRLWVRTAHCDDKDEADLLERAMIRNYAGMGYHLWNKIRYGSDLAPE